jgi:hypothetical protein
MRIRAGDKLSTSDVNGDMSQGVPNPVPNGYFLPFELEGVLISCSSDNALAINEIWLALSNISSNLNKLLPVERQHVVPPAIAALASHDTLFDLHDRLTPVLQIRAPHFPHANPPTYRERHFRGLLYPLAGEFCLACVDYFETHGPPARRDERDDGCSSTFPHGNRHMFSRPGRRLMNNIAPQPIKQDEPPVNVEELEVYYLTSPVIPEPERNDEPPVILDKTGLTSAALESTASDKPPATADKTDPVPTPAGPGVQNEQNIDNPTVSVSPVPPEPVARVEQAISVLVEQPSQQPEPSFDHWSPTLLEIKQRIEPLASGSLQRLPQSNQVCVLMPALVAHPYHS